MAPDSSNGGQDAIIRQMKAVRTPIHTGSSADLAFAVLVLGAYFTTFSSITEISVKELIALTGLGMLYLTIGVYGYSYCVRSKRLLLQLGYFAIQITLGSSIIYLTGQTSYNALLLLPLAGHSVVLLAEPWWYLANGILVLAYTLTVRLLTGGWDVVWVNLPIFLAGQISVLVFTQMTVGEERARREIQGLVSKLETANEQLRDYALKAEMFATATERNRIAREIHDGLGHHLTALNMQIRAANAILTKNPQKAQDFLSNAENITHEALVDVRQSVSALRERANDDRPLLEQIEGIAEMWRNANTSILVSERGQSRSVSQQTAWTIFRAAQEAVSNSIKYANATQIEMVLDYEDPLKMILRIMDDGIGAESIDGGFGLVGIRERAELLRGTLEITTARGKGFEIRLTLPTGE